MDLTIDRDSPVPVYRQIVARLREMIVTGALPPGFRLPPERRLAEALGVNRSTVLTAYRELKADALVDAHVGRGTTVLAKPSHRPVAGSDALPWRQMFHDSASGGPDPVIRDLLAMAERPDVISLSIGLPAPELLPLQTLLEVMRKAVAEVGPAVLLHCPTEGHTPLRESLAQWLVSRGIRCDASEVLVLSGSQQGLDLVARLLLEPGATVVVEEPTYIGALEVFRRLRVRLIGVPVDEQGMRTDVLESVLERTRPRLVYTLPTFQNPSGTVLSVDRRRHLLELAYRFQVPILEDDPYGELAYEGNPPPSLKALDDRQHVLYLSTFSKVLFPGMRLGFMVAPRPVLRQLVLLKQGVDLHASSLGQWMLDGMLRDGLWEPHVRSLRTEYATRRDVMERALDSSGVTGLEWRKPSGGFYIWCRLPDDVDPTRLAARAGDRGVAYLPGSACFPHEASEPFIRLNFSYPSPDDIRLGVDRLADAMRSSVVRRDESGGRPTGTRPVV